jgi:hypothetical protein
MTIDFENISVDGLKSSTVLQMPAGMQSNKSGYFKNKYNPDFV